MRFTRSANPVTLFWLLFLGTVTAGEAARLEVYCDGSLPQAEFAVQELGTAVPEAVDLVPLAKLGRETDRGRIVLATVDDADIVERMRSSGARPVGDLKPEGFSIRASRVGDARTIWVIGADDAGLMYGGLELAEILRIKGLDAVVDVDKNAYMAMRGTKFNIPLDVRTPTYTEPGDAAQKNLPEMWSLAFWKAYIDNLARHRYNFVSLWSLHPFPSMVRVPGYEDVALRDVRRSTVEWKENYDLNGTGFDAPEIVDNFETLKVMSIDEKMDFWRKVMRYAKGRNVSFYVVTWNIFVNGTDGKYGITDEIDNPTTRDYFRKSVKQMFLTYPNLAGVGLTTGENMHGSSFEEKEDWAFETYAQGVLDAAAEQPDRRFTLIHRQHQTGARDIARKFKPLIDADNVDFLFSFKYAKAHVFSSTRQPYHPGFVEDIEGMKTIWTLRNDDVYCFRWGAPDFVRAFLRNIPYNVSQGYYYGSDQWVWGREFLSMEPESPRQLELAKHWYHWMLWGRLGYDPEISNARFVGILQQRYPQVSAEDLFTAWQEASMIYPVTTGFHWGALDFQWYIESCKSRPGPAQTESGFHDVNRFITLGTHGGTDNISIPKYVKATASGRELQGTSPVEVAAKLHGHADKALALLEGMTSGGNRELRHTLHDIRAIALLGKYYAHKIRGATELALFRETKNTEHQRSAIDELNQAARCWRLYASTALSQYANPFWTNRVGYCDWRELFRYVLDDVRTASGEPQVESMVPTRGGTILEAEAARSTGMRKTARDGTGCLEPAGTAEQRRIEWTFEASQDGVYLFELRYAFAEQETLPCQLRVNGRSAGPIVVWHSGGESVWAWDRLAVRLSEGVNRICLTGDRLPAVDHLNVLPTFE